MTYSPGFVSKIWSFVNFCNPYRSKLPDSGALFVLSSLRLSRGRLQSLRRNKESFFSDPCRSVGCCYPVQNGAHHTLTQPYSEYYTPISIRPSSSKSYTRRKSCSELSRALPRPNQILPPIRHNRVSKHYLSPSFPGQLHISP